VKVDLQKLPSEQLVDLQLHRNDWYVRHARRILQERGPNPDVHARLKRILNENPDVTRKLRALWALHVTQGVSEAELIELLRHQDEYIRSWAIHLLVENRQPSDASLRRFAELARQDSSALVRLYLASALQRVPVQQRWEVLSALLARNEDASDHNLPLMLWYAAEPVVESNMTRSLDAAALSKMPNLFAYTIQRIAAAGSQNALRVLTERLGATEDPGQQKELVNGITLMVNKK
jgi:hypothetical protein